MNRSTTLLMSLLLLASAVNAESMTDADTVRSWVSYLASDQMQGRGNGSKEITQASDWIAQHFDSAGLVTVPGNETFFQAYENGKQHAYRNVIGYLPGSDPDLADEYIVLSAHYDHIGKDGAKIFNGADDNASGTSTVIGLAYELAVLKPKRSILFVAWSGEEEGMLGSKFYVSDPLLPLDNAVLNLNFEMVGHTEGQGKQQFWVTGSEYSTLYSSLKRMGTKKDWRISRTPYPDLQLFWRSDNVSFVQLASDQQTRTVYGIPAHSISTWGQEGHYHSPSDDPDSLDYENLSALINVLGGMVNELAKRTDVVEWRDRSDIRLRAYKDRP